MSDRPVIAPLFLGMTRPPMIKGVTYTFFVANVTITTILFLASNNLAAFLVGPPVHIVGYLMCLKDPRLFDLWRIKLTKTTLCRNRQFWRANSYQP